MQWLFAALAALLFAGAGKNARGKKITQGTAQLRGGRAYRIELELSGPALTQAADHPVKVAQGMDNQLRMSGAYDVLIQPTIPLQVSYSIVPQGDLPVVLNVPVTQMIVGIPADYTFRSVQQLETPARAA